MKQEMKYLIDEYQLRQTVLERMLEIIQQNQYANPNGVVFYGDSITEFCDLERYYPLIKNKYNCGIHGITTTMLLHFIDEGVIKYQPSKVVIMAGVNDLGNTEMHSPREIAKKVKEMTEIILGNLPECQVYLISPLPCDEHLQGYEQKESIRNNYMIYQIFKEYQKIILDPRVSFIDVFDCIDANDFRDGLHILDSGYTKVCSRIMQELVNK